MEIRIQPGEWTQVSPTTRDRIMLWSVVPQAEGVAVTLDAAQREHVRLGCHESGVWVWTVLFAPVLFLPLRDFDYVLCLLIFVTLISGLLLAIGLRSNRWRRHTETLVADMPAPATPVRVDANGLTVGSTTTPWSALKLVLVYLRAARPSPRYRFRSHVQQLVLDVAGKQVVLDAVAITHGQEIVDTIFNRLSPET